METSVQTDFFKNLGPTQIIALCAAIPDFNHNLYSRIDSALTGHID